MSARLPAAVRVPVAAFRTVARLLPLEFRSRWFAQAEGDLERALLDVHRRRGGLAALAAGLRAVLDLMWAVPRERWDARRVHEVGRNRAGAAGHGMGERLMSVLANLRLASRALARRPAYAGAAVLTLALGIGANVAIFAVVNAVLLRPLPYPEPEGIVTVMHHAPGLDLADLGSSEGTLHFYDQEADYLAAITGYRTTSRNLVGALQPELISVVDAGPELLDILRVPPFLGRAFNEADGAEGAPGVAILGYDFWSSRFGRDAAVVGRSVLLDGESTEIVGVMPRGFAFPDAETDAYPARFIDPGGDFGSFGMSSIARLAPGVTVQQAAERSAEIQPRLFEYFPDVAGSGFIEQAGWSVTVETLQEQLVGDVASTLWIVLGTVTFVLLIACANVANLFLVRAESRQKELAIRAAMGAGSGRIAWSFMSEALVLGMAGGVLGVALSCWECTCW